MKKQMIKLIKVVSFILVIAAIMASFACKKPVEPKVVNVKDLYDLLVASGKLPELTAVPERDLSEVYGIDPTKLSQWVFGMSENYSVDAGEVAIFEVNDAAYVSELQQKLQNHLDRIKAVSKDYSPEQSSKLEPVQVTSAGNYVYLIVGEDYSALMKIMKDNIG